MSRTYFRPIISADVARPDVAVTCAGGWATHAEVLERGRAPQVVRVADVPAPDRAAWTVVPAGPPRIMGIVNATPDSFSDGGLHGDTQGAIAAGLAMAQAGAAILDVGGESTRPGAHPVSTQDEIARTAPVIAGLRAQGFKGTISIDTRKAGVARSALAAGADLINDVSGFTHDPDLAGVAAAAGVPVCVMHGPFDPATMHDDPQYADVLLDVYDWLEGRITALEAAGIARAHITADPGIGFGKTQAHNLALLARLGLFHGLGVPLLLGASRKRFIGAIGGAAEPAARAPGSIAVGLGGIAQGVQTLRVHDVAQTAQAIALWRASMAGS